MAPRIPETREEFIPRLRREAKKGATTIPFGGHHFSHVVCHEGVWRLRRWELDPAKAAEFIKENGSFMPENAEAISEPGQAVLLEAATLDAFIVKLLAAWPL